MSRRGRYLGGGTTIYEGPSSQPHGTRISSPVGGAKRLSRTARMTSGMIAKEVPEVAGTISRVLSLIDSRTIHLPKAELHILRRINSILAAFDGRVDRTRDSRWRKGGGFLISLFRTSNVNCCN